MGKNCQICGKNSGMYPLCREHLQMKNEGSVIKCEECGTWHLTKENCSCKEKKIYTELPREGFDKCIICGTETNGFAFCTECWKEHTTDEMLDIINGKHKTEENAKIKEDPQEQNNKIAVTTNNKSNKCLTCGYKTEGLLFCSKCYNKYKGKELLLKITNCSDFELLDASYEGIYTCKDGHIVKSKGERDVDNYLFDHNIQHAYEKELYYGAGENDKIKPDFYLPDYLGPGKDIYIEYWGYSDDDNYDYKKTKKFKMEKYRPMCKDKELTLICIYEKTDANKIDTKLDWKLNKKRIEEFKINFEE